MANGEHTRFERTMDTAERDAEIIRMRATGMTFQAISKHFGVSRQACSQAFSRALRETVREPTHEVIALELERLDALYRTALGVMARSHPLSQNGRIVRGDDKQPLEDSGPRLAAIDRCLRIMDRRARLLGLDAPVKADVRVTDSLDREIERLAAELQFVAGLTDVRQEAPEESDS